MIVASTGQVKRSGAKTWYGGLRRRTAFRLHEWPGQRTFSVGFPSVMEESTDDNYLDRSKNIGWLYRRMAECE